MIPLAESIPIGRDAVISGPRSFGWRADLGATIYYVEALDGGDPNVKTEHRDQVYTLDSPFNSNPEPFVKLNHRYSGIQWGNNDVALVSARKWSIRRTTTWLVNPTNKSAFSPTQ